MLTDFLIGGPKKLTIQRNIGENYHECYIHCVSHINKQIISVVLLKILYVFKILYDLTNYSTNMKCFCQAFETFSSNAKTLPKAVVVYHMIFYFKVEVVDFFMQKK